MFNHVHYIDVSDQRSQGLERKPPKYWGKKTDMTGGVMEILMFSDNVESETVEPSLTEAYQNLDAAMHEGFSITVPYKDGTKVQALKQPKAMSI